jgi:purine nucleosidase
MRKLLVCAALFGMACAMPAHARELVFLDNDFSGPGETNIQSLYPAFGDPDVTIVGIGAVTGDAWRDEGAAHLLRFLELSGHGAIAVYPGADQPLLRTRSEMTAWEAQYGTLLWKGAWQPSSPKRFAHPDDPRLVPTLVEGAPSIRMRPESAARAMIEVVHRYPHQVTIVAGGPLTDLALATTLDPSFPGLAKQLVFMGGLIDIDQAQIAVELRHTIDFYTDFNMIFDPEAAHIVLSAPWSRITNVGDITLSVLLTPELVSRAAQGRSGQSAYFHRYAVTGGPMWDELTMAIAIHPEIVTSSVQATMDVETARGMFYGRAHARAPSLTPGTRPPVRIVTGVDVARFYDVFGAALNEAR